MASGIIIMCVGDYLLYASALITQRSPLIALPAAINNTTQPKQTDAPLQGVAVQQPGISQTTTTTTTSAPGAYGANYGTAETTQVTQAGGYQQQQTGGVYQSQAATGQGMHTAQMSGQQQPVA